MKTEHDCESSSQRIPCAINRNRARLWIKLARDAEGDLRIRARKWCRAWLMETELVCQKSSSHRTSCSRHWYRARLPRNKNWSPQVDGKPGSIFVSGQPSSIWVSRARGPSRARPSASELDIYVSSSTSSASSSHQHSHNRARFLFIALGTNRARIQIKLDFYLSRSVANRARIGLNRAQLVYYSSSFPQWKTREIPVLVYLFKNKWNYFRKSTLLAHFCRSYPKLPFHVKTSCNPSFFLWARLPRNKNWSVNPTRWQTELDWSWEGTEPEP